jgi:ribonuclease T2
MWRKILAPKFHRSPEPVEGRLPAGRASTSSALRFSFVSLWVAIGSVLLTSSDRPAIAQAWQCKAPANLPRPKPSLPKAGEVRRTPVASYILALSWSREHCKSRERNPKQSIQCNGSIGDFGFVLHGLWPEAAGADYPQWCRKTGLVSRKVIAQNICMTPSVDLIQHEWAKHGTCMSRRPETYFGAARLLFNAIEFPDMDRLSRQGEKAGNLNSAALAEAFAANNDGLPASAIKVQTNRKGWLEEVRICLDKKFKPMACPAFVKGAPDKAEVKVWRGS